MPFVIKTDTEFYIYSILICFRSQQELILAMLFFSEFISKKYGHPLYRVPVDLPFSCPHRLRDGGKGCIFCPEDGARARHLQRNLNLDEQIERGIEYVRKRYGHNVGLIAYFQSFTNTNAPLKEIKKYYNQVLTSAEFEVVIISTRPDCLPPEVLSYISELNKKYDLWIELGVQSAIDSTLSIINRQHDFQCVKNAVNNLAERNIKTAAHIILGLPGEGISEFRRTATELVKLPFSGIKIHNLLVLKNTPMAGIYQKQQQGEKTGIPEIKPMNEYEYAEALSEFLKLIPENWPLMRITADASPKDIIAPRWWMKKGQFIEYFKQKVDNEQTSDSPLPKVETSDGSFTLYHPEFRQHFHSLAGAETEAQKKFLEPCEIRQKLESGIDIKILDIGFGLGLNAVSALEAAEEISKGKIKILTLENDSKTLKIAADLNPDISILKSISEQQAWSGHHAEIKALIGDARKTIQTLNEKFDAVFLDPFSPESNQELWTYDFILKISGLLKEKGVIVTYSAAFPVKGALLRCGLKVGETPSFGRKRGGTIASFAKEKITQPLSDKETNIILKSSVGVPYRDPSLSKSRKEISAFRRKTVKRLQKKGVPKWYKP